MPALRCPYCRTVLVGILLPRYLRAILKISFKIFSLSKNEIKNDTKISYDFYCYNTCTGRNI